MKLKQLIKTLTLGLFGFGVIGTASCGSTTTTEQPTSEPTSTPTSVPTTTPPIYEGFDTISIARALELCEEAGTAGTTDKYYVYGIVKEVSNSTYGAMTITDGTDELYIYGTKSADGEIRYDALEEKPVAGDEVVVYGRLLTYGTTKEMESGWIVAMKKNSSSVTPGEPDNTPILPSGTGIWSEYNNLISIEYANYLANLAGEAGTSERYLVFGTVKNVSNSLFGEMTITDGVNELYVYGTYSADGNSRYDALEEKPVAGDQVVLSCLLSTFNGKPQVKSGWLLSMYHEEVTIDPTEYVEKTIAETRTLAKDSKVLVSGVVAKITYADGMVPNGIYLIDNTGSIYIYGGELAGQCKVGNTVKVAATKDYYVLEKEQSAADKHGYQGCNQLSNALLVENDGQVSEFDKSWITESTVKEIMNTPLTTNITTNVYKVNALIKKVEGTGFVNYYINDLDGYTGSYCYSQASGADFAYLDEFDGKICTVYLSPMNCKSEASGCFYRLNPILVIDEGFTFDLANTPDHVLEYYAKDQFLSRYEANPELEVVTEVSSSLLGFEGATIAYESSDENVVFFNVVEGKTYFNTKDSGTAIVKITVTYQTYVKTLDIQINVTTPDAYDTVNVSQAIAAELSTVVTVRAIISGSLVNKDGFYLTDETGNIAVLVREISSLKGLKSGDEVIVSGTRDIFNYVEGQYIGNICLTNADILVNLYGNNEYSTATFITGKTFQELYDTSYTEQHSNEVYVVTGKFELIETDYYTSCKLTSVDGNVTLTLYCASAGQYSFLNAISGKEAVFELAMCNWNKKKFYAYCVISATCEGVKYVNELNFQ